MRLALAGFWCVLALAPLRAENAQSPVITVHKGTAVVVDIKEVAGAAGATAGSVLRNDIQLSGALALGDPNSTSSFAYPLVMLLDAGVDPEKDLAKIYFAGSHVNSLAACAEKRVDAGAASFVSFEKAVDEKRLASDALRPIGRSLGLRLQLLRIRRPNHR